MQDKTIQEQDKHGLVTHRYKWIDKSELLNFDIKPKQIVEYIINNNSLTHFVTKE